MDFSAPFEGFAWRAVVFGAEDSEHLALPGHTMPRVTFGRSSFSFPRGAQGTELSLGQLIVQTVNFGTK